MRIRQILGLVVTAFLAVGGLTACGTGYPAAPTQVSQSAGAGEYLIGPGDNLQVFVWRNPELSVSVPVRPDGKFSVPLVSDVTATGKTPAQLADELESRLAAYVEQPVVTVMVTGFTGPFSQQIRVVGEATQPRAVSYRNGMTVLDAIIEVGGITEYAAGNRAVIVRRAGGGSEAYEVRLDDLIRAGDITANVELAPGDVIIIPESWL